MGLGALSTVAVAFGPASPASAVIAPPGSVTVQVCNALPGGLGGVLDQAAANFNLLTLLSDEIAADGLDLTGRTTDLVNALVSHIQTVDGGGNVAATSSVVSAQASAYADSAAEWTKDVKAFQTAELPGPGAQHAVRRSGCHRFGARLPRSHPASRGLGRDPSGLLWAPCCRGAPTTRRTTGSKGGVFG